MKKIAFISAIFALCMFTACEPEAPVTPTPETPDTEQPSQPEDEGNETPDYAKCVDISTSAALKEMILPAIIAFVSPILIALRFSSQRRISIFFRPFFIASKGSLFSFIWCIIF